MKDPHCRIKSITVRMEDKRPGASFCRHIRTKAGVEKHVYNWVGISADGKLAKAQLVWITHG